MKAIVEKMMEPAPTATQAHRSQGCLCGRPFGQFHLVVVRKLPRTRETLLIRLLSRGKTFSHAVKDILEVRNTVPELALIAAEVMHVLIAFKKELHQRSAGGRRDGSATRH